MKKIKVISSLVLSCVVAFPIFASAESTENENAGNVADKYEIGEQLNEKDLDYILENAHVVKNDSIQTSSIRNYSISGSKRSSDNNVEGDVFGSFTADLGFINNSVTGNMKTSTVRGNVTAAKSSFRFVGYGAVSTESPYIGKVADWTQTASGKTSASLGISKTFTASVSVWTATAEGTLNYPNGVLNITGFTN